MKSQRKACYVELYTPDQWVASPPAPRPEQPPVAVVDSVTGKPVYVTREQSMGMTPASAMESLSPKEIQRREAVFPQATSSVKATEENSDKLITQLESLRDHKGLSGITGLVYGNTPALTREARNASTILENIMSKGTLGVLCWRNQSQRHHLQPWCPPVPRCHVQQHLRYCR